MKSKAISPMIATILLIAFTVAVGGIISVWLTGFTRTQTTAVGAGAACTVNTVLVKFLKLNQTHVTLQFLNQGTDDVTISSIIITCGGTVVNQTLNLGFFVASNSQNITTIPISEGNCAATNLGIHAIATCSKGGTYTTTCPEGTCSV